MNNGRNHEHNRRAYQRRRTNLGERRCPNKVVWEDAADMGAVVYKARASLGQAGTHTQTRNSVRTADNITCHGFLRSDIFRVDNGSVLVHHTHLRQHTLRAFWTDSDLYHIARRRSEVS